MRPAQRMLQFEESIIREMTRHAPWHGAINLSQGYPDFAPPTAVTEAAVAALMAVVEPGDEVLFFEPAHENFRPATIMAGATPVPVPLGGM